MLAIARHDNRYQPWLNALTPHIPAAAVPDIQYPDEVTMLLCWKPDANVCARFPNLKAIYSMGAGIDFLLQDETIPDTVAIGRLVEPTLGQAMFEYALATTLYFTRDLHRYRRQQQQALWQARRHSMMAKTSVGVMGLGEVGRVIAEGFSRNGFNVSGWSHTRKAIPNVSCFGATELEHFLPRCQVLINCLPLTPVTEGILERQLFAQLPQGAVLINVGRGAHLAEADLLSALASGQLSAAALDVFSQEPLPAGHPFWQHPDILITPHCASLTDINAVAAQIIENYHALMNNQPLKHLIDRQRGY